MSIIVADPARIDMAQLDLLARMAKDKGIKRLYLHWTGGHYGHVYDSYHVSIGKNGELYLPENEIQLDAFVRRRSHTYQRNTGALGITLCCGYGAKISAGGIVDFGPEPPTCLQIEAMARVIAHITHYLGIVITPYTVQTHGEVADADGYGPGGTDPDLRWDLWVLEDLPFRMGLHPGGEVLRGKASYYLEHEFGQREEVNEGCQLTKKLLNAA